jgi:hypothetical protein
MEDIITHGLQAEAKTGQNGGLNPSSIHPGDKPLALSKFAKSVISDQGGPVNPHAGEDWQTRPVSAEQAVPTTPGMRNRSHEGGVIPSVTDRGPKE